MKSIPTPFGLRRPRRSRGRLEAQPIALVGVVALLGLFSSVGFAAEEANPAAPAAQPGAPAAPPGEPAAPPAVSAAPPAAPVAPPAASASFPPAQIDQIVAPIALYPDALLSQVMMASTYPLEIVKAARWLKANSGLTGDKLDDALAPEPWDPSVKSLTHFPSVLEYMSTNLDWTQDLGDAFLGQREQVFASIQRLRADAYAAGNLKSSEQQTVVKKGDTIIVQPATPQVIYVPAYNPTVVYGPAFAPPTYYYPTVMTYPPWYTATASLLSFGAGIAVGAAIWGGCNWGTHNVYINNNYNGWKGAGNVNNINISGNNVNISGNNINRNRQNWEFKPEHRGAVPYRDQNVARQYGGDRASSTRPVSRDSARGFDRPPPTERAAPKAKTAGKVGTANRPASRPNTGASGDRTTAPKPAQNRSNAATRDSAFAGAKNANLDRAASTRGAASRGLSPSRPQGGAPARGAAAPAKGGGSAGRSVGTGGGARTGGGSRR